MRDHHVVDVYCGDAFFSGYLIAPSLVLTCHHGVLAGSQSKHAIPSIPSIPSIARLADANRFECRAVWQDESLDLLLLEVTDEDWWPTRRTTPVRLGALPEVTPLHEGHAAIPCVARGFPVAQRRPDAVRDVETMSGLIHAGTGALAGHIQIQVTSGSLDRAARRSGWRGMSGAALFVADRLVGVLVETHHYIPSRLNAVPAVHLLDDPEAAEILARHAVPTTAETVVMPGRAEQPSRPAIGLVPARADFFQERPEQTALDHAAAEGETVVLTQVLAGMGGIGKTQLAADYARRAWEEHRVDLLIWVTAASETTVVAAYAEAARQLRLSYGSTAESAAASLVNWLRQTDRVWLVVLDDVTRASEVAPWLPSGDAARGRTIVTTRSRDTATQALGRVVQVDLFTPQQSLAYLTMALRPTARHPLVVLDDAAALAEDLGHLPIALAQAATYIGNKQTTCADYRRRLRDRAQRLPAPDPGRLPKGHTRSVGAALYLSVEAADELEPRNLAGHVIRFASTLDPHGIPTRLFTSAPAVRYFSRTSGAGSAPGMVTTDQVNDALANLHTMHAVTITADSVQLHELVQRSTIDRTGTEELGEAVFAAAESMLTVWPDLERDHAYAQTLRNNSAALRVHDVDALWRFGAHPLLFREGRSLGEWGQAGGALAFFRRLEAEAMRNRGHAHPDTLRIKSEMAHWLKRTGEVSAALALARQVFGQQAQVLGVDHRDTLTTRRTIASTLGESGQVGQAIDELTVLLADQRRVLGWSHRDTIMTRRRLGEWHGQAGNGEVAMSTLAELLEDAIEALGPDDPETLAIRKSFALWMGDTQFSETVLHKLRDRLAERGEADVGLGSYRQIGAAGVWHGDPKAMTVIPQLEKTLEASVQRRGADHPETLSLRDRLAYWEGRGGYVQRALLSYRELVRDRTRVLGAMHPDTLTTRHNEAFWMARGGAYRLALSQFEELLPDTIAVRGEDHQDTIATRHNIANWSGEVYGAADAVARFETLLGQTVRVLGEDHHDTLVTRNNFANWRGLDGDVRGAVEILTVLLETRIQLYGAQSQQVRDSRKDLEYWRRILPDVNPDGRPVAEAERPTTIELTLTRRKERAPAEDQTP